MKLPKNIIAILKKSIPYAIAEDCEIFNVIMIDGVTSGDIMIYSRSETHFDCDVYSNQGGIPVTYEHTKATTFLNWEEVEFLIKSRKESGWEIRAIINEENGWAIKDDCYKEGY